jgi:G3E family GTPase
VRCCTTCTTTGPRQPSTARKPFTRSRSGARSAIRVSIAREKTSHGIGSFVFTEARPIPWLVFSRAIETLVALRAPDLLRVKGFLAVEGCRGPVVVQVVQHLTNLPLELESWPDGTHESRVVFITRGITEKQVRDLIGAVWSISAVVPAKTGTHTPQQN